MIHRIGNFNSNQLAGRMINIAKNLIDDCEVLVTIVNRPTATHVDITHLGEFMIGKHDHIELKLVDPMKRSDPNFAAKLGVVLKCATLLGSTP